MPPPDHWHSLNQPLVGPDFGAVGRAGWQLPNGSTDNWWREHVRTEDVVVYLLDGLRCARTCLLPDVVTVSTGLFPPRPRGGLPVPLAAPWAASPPDRAAQPAGG